ncbi:conserved hypothetical protein [Theileria equi strain WA]|uniref:Uncharacterized protein n=1 Tax=Theileria equi strain WA TaxID=1537102 RepID=L1LAC5_THEEQ|nr:conserved hypothetical protein [Theileria equi strain WA]EKX72427.1 conserved hypothetical protein [Theileria equi strain WA]|eukprot:XP_004831879.1 conserved hypothetical protein [Theileria equi strain WA]
MTLSPFGDPYGSFLANLCPVNVFRPIPQDSFTLVDKHALEQIYNEEILKFPDYKEKLCDIYGIQDCESVNVKNYKDLVKLYQDVLHDKQLLLSKLIQMQTGCVFKTNVKIERIVKNVAKEREYVRHSVLIVIIFLVLEWMLRLCILQKPRWKIKTVMEYALYQKLFFDHFLAHFDS